MSRQDDNLSDADVAAIADFADSSHFSEIEKAVLQYSTEMSSAPVRIDDRNFGVLKGQFSSKQMVELTATIAHENFRARYNHAFGIGSADFDTSEAR